MSDESWLIARFARFVPDAIKAAWNDVLSAIANDWSISELARALQHDLSIALSDAVRIARTESMDDYRDATLGVYRAAGDTVVGWRWVCAADACPICQALNGSEHPLSEDQEAPHPNCRCGQEPIFASDTAA